MLGPTARGGAARVAAVNRPPGAGPPGINQQTARGQRAAAGGMLIDGLMPARAPQHHLNQLSMPTQTRAALCSSACSRQRLGITGRPAAVRRQSSQTLC